MVGKNFMMVMAFVVYLMGACAGGGGGEQTASDDNVAGLWNGLIADDERSGERLRNVLQFDPPADGATQGRYGIFGEELSGPIYGNRPLLGLMQQGTWHVADDHVAFAARNGELTANEILSFTGSTLTLESAATVSGSLKYQRTTDCPDPIEREGWSVTTRALMANEIQGGGTGGGATVAVDSKGRAHVVAGGDSLTYFTRQEGCFWQAYSFGPANSRGQLLITPDDALHVVGTSDHGFFHFTASADSAAQSSASWSQVAPGPLNGVAGSFNLIATEAVADINGNLWVVEPLPHPTTSILEPNVFKYNGTWTAMGAIPYDTPYPPDQYHLNGDANGNVHLTTITQGPWEIYGVYNVYDAANLATPPVVIPGQPKDTPLHCAVNDLYIDSSGAVHAACGTPVAGAPGGYLTNESGDWTFEALTRNAINSLVRVEGGVILYGSTLYRKTATGWRAPSPGIYQQTTGFIPDLHFGEAVVDPAGVVHYANTDYYGYHQGFPEGILTTVELTIRGTPGGEIRSADEKFSCTESCAVEVESGSIIRLQGIDGEMAIFAGWGNEPVTVDQVDHANGDRTIWAFGERIAIEANFTNGGMGLEPVQFPGMGNPLAGILNDSSMVVAGAFEDGFAPEGTPLAPINGIVAPFAMGLDAEGAVTWFNNLDNGAYAQRIGFLDIASDGTLALGLAADGASKATLGGATHTAAGTLVGVVDAATGTEVWSEVVAGTAVEMVAIPGGGVAVIGGVASGTTGVLCLDGTGTTSGELALGPIPMKTGVYKDLTWLAALGSDSVIVGTTEVNLTGSVHLVSTAGELLWSTTVGGAPLFVSRSDSGGAWVVSNYSRPDELPDCLGSGEGGLLHFDKSGQCTAMASSFLGGLGAMRADGLVAILGNNGKGQLAVITQGEAPEDNSFLPFWPEDGSQTGKVAWSPDGTRLVYTFRILQDDVFTDAIGWARF